MTIRASVLDEEEPLTLHMKSAGLTDGQFYQLCADNPELRLELTANRELLIMSPTGGKTGRRNTRLTQRLANWAEKDGTGEAFDSSTGFSLPNGTKRSPDASWVRRSRWEALTEAQQEEFLPLCPDFVVELRSILCPHFKLRWKSTSQTGPNSAGSLTRRPGAFTFTVPDRRLSASRARRR